MTKEDIEWLLKDLCARLPYKVFIHYHWSREGNTIDEDRELDFSDVETLMYNIENPQNDWCEISWKPYLRSMSSMTQEEIEKYRQLCETDDGDFTGEPLYFNTCESFDYLNSIHVDYRNFIQRGLALEAPKDMYK